MTSSQGQERAISSAINTSEVAPNAASGLGTVEASDRATLELKGSLKSLGHEPDNAPAPSDVAVKPTENPKTEFEKQKQETQGELQDIINERQKLAET